MSRNDKSGSVLVVGSANMDMVVKVDRFPRPGETILGGEFAMHPGGKGANQAVACAKLGGNVVFIGKMGRDDFRTRLSENMANVGIGLDHLLEDAEAPTGIAIIAVDADAQNEIIVVSGSNMRLTPDDLEKHRDAFESADIILLQLEIPLETVHRAAELGRDLGKTVILNPAPARELPDSLLGLIDYLTPNETEAEILTGIDVTDDESAGLAARALLKRGVRNVLMTLGARGALLVNNRTRLHFPAPEVVPVDTTAAGDAFNGALAFFLLSDMNVDEAIRMANAVAALSVCREGAQPSMPTFIQVEEFLRPSEGEGEMVEVSPEELD